MIPIIAVLIALVIGAIVMAIGGYNPLLAYQSLVGKIFGSVYDIGETIRAIIPLLLSGLAVAVASKAGIFNIGVDGQIIMGAVSSLLVLASKSSCCLKSLWLMMAQQTILLSSHTVFRIP